MEILGAPSFDARSNCISVLTEMSLREYKGIAFDSYKDNGGLTGQRGVIKSTAAQKIRKRMHEDFKLGAIFPQVVIGVLKSTEELEGLKAKWIDFRPEDFQSEDFFDKSQITIIDGMQRSNIYFSNYDGNEDRKIRVEVWVSDKSVKLLYRMLVLNTGQSPWNTRRQVEVMYSSIAKSILNRLTEKNQELSSKIDIYGIDDKKRRSKPGQFQKNTMIELYLAYSTRKVKVELDNALADEYQRFDMMEAVDNTQDFDLFIDAFLYLCRLDFALSEYSDCAEEGQFRSGKDLFGSGPACIGFIVACAEYVSGLGKRKDDIRAAKNNELAAQIDSIISLLDKHKDNSEYIALKSLNEVLSSVPKSRIGDVNRDYFKMTFREILSYEDIEEVDTLEVFWRTHG